MPIRPVSTSPPLLTEPARHILEEGGSAPHHSHSLADSALQNTVSTIRGPQERAGMGKFNFLAMISRNSTKQGMKLTGFKTSEIAQLKSLGEAEQKFVTENNAKLRVLKYKPIDMLSLAVQSQASRDFVIESGHHLSTFTPTEINSCSLLPKTQRDFVVLLSAQMDKAGWKANDRFELSNASPAHLQFLTHHWELLAKIPLNTTQMHMFAKMPLHTRELLTNNMGPFTPLTQRNFTNNQWMEILKFTEHQCYRLIRETSDRNIDNDQLLDNISRDPGSFKWPKNLGWLDDTSKDSLYRWASYNKVYVSQASSQVSTFCNRVFSDTFSRRLYDEPTAKPVGTLIAGLAFTKDQQKNSDQNVSRAKAVLEYLESKNDLKLWAECEVEARDAVEACSDRVDYGFARLTQVIERHRMTSGEVNPKAYMVGVLRQFNREQVDIAAQVLAMEKGTESENVEVYLNLAIQLSRQGIDLGQLPDNALYIDSPKFRVDSGQITQVKTQLENHYQTRSPEFRAAFEDDLAAQSALREMFPAHYKIMMDELSETEEKASDLLLEANSSDLQRQTARKTLEGLATKQADWYGEKAQEFIRRELIR